MALTTLQLQPGINKEVTAFATQGGYYDCNKVRFRFGFPEKIGGWTNYSVSYTFNGTARSLFNWVTFDSQNLLAVGTNQKYYVENGGQYYDITPIRATYSFAAGTIGANPLTTTSGSPLVLVAITAHVTTVGSYVTFFSMSPFNNINLNGQYEVVSILDGNNFYVLASTNASASGTGGGSASQAVFLINAGNAVYSVGSGWGSGSWGNGGWGQGGPGTVGFPLQLWSQSNFYQDLVFSPQSGPLYYWTYTILPYSAAITLNAYANTQNLASTTTTAPGTGVTSISVSDASFIYTGAVIVGSGIPVGTYVTTAYGGGLTVTLSQAVTVTNGQIIQINYAGLHVPNQTNRVFVSSTYSFIIALGSNSYSPVNFSAPFDPMLVRWSDQGNAAEWIPKATNQAGQQRVSNGSYLVTAQNNQQQILLWTNSAIYSMQYVGPPYVFSINLMMDNISIASPNAAITANNVTYWMGLDKLYMFNGTVSTLPCTLRRYVFSNLNANQINQVVAGYNEGFNEVWWMYPSLNSTVNDSYLIYNFLENLWYYGSLNRTAWLGSSLRQYPMAVFSVQNTYVSPQGLNSTDTSVTVINALSYPMSGIIQIDSEQISYTANANNTLTGCVRGVNNTAITTHAGYAAVTLATPNQVLYHEYGTDDNSTGSVQPISAYIESSSFDIQQGQQLGFVWRVVPDITFTNSTSSNPQVLLSVKAKQNPGSDFFSGYGTPSVTQTTPPPTPPAAIPIEQYTGQVYTRVRGRDMSFRVESTGLGVQWQMGAMRIDIKPDGKR